MLYQKAFQSYHLGVSLLPVTSKGVHVCEHRTPACNIFAN